MKSCNLFKIVVFILVCLSSYFKTYAQLCSGKQGIPVMLETFGTGNAIGAPLPAGITNYPYVAGWPADGSYTIATSSDPGSQQPANWHNGRDHTGDLNGEMMVVNADYTPGEFFRKSVTNLCPNTRYTFSAWLANVNTPTVVTNVCSGQYVYPKILFNIENPDGSIGAGISTGNIPVSPSLSWTQYGLTFTTGPAQTSLNLVMINNGPGGCGNDIVIDDISFAICGPTATIVANPPKAAYCIGENLSLNGSITPGIFNNPEYQWQYSSDNNITWSNLAGQKAANLSLSPLTLSKKGNYRLLVAETGNIGSLTCGIVSDTLLINVVPPPVFTVNSPTTCTGTPATLTTSLDPASAATSYVWDNGAAGASISVSPSVTTPYTATGTDINGCKSTASGTVTVKLAPVVNVQPASMCAGEKRTLTATGNAISFTWSPSTGLNTTTGATVEASPINTTTYTLTGTGNGCTITTPVLVTVNPRPSIAASPAAFCAGSSVTLLATGNAASVIWSPGTGLSSTSTNQVIAKPDSTTIYKLKGTTGACSDSVNVTVTVNPIPAITMTVQSPTICTGGSTPLTAGSSAVSTTYLWTPNDGSLNATAGPAVSANPLVTTTYTVIGKDGNGCMNSATGTVTVANPSIVVPPHAPICAGDTAELTASGSASYSWIPNDGSLNTTTGPKVVARPLNTTTYIVTGSNPGCSTHPTATVTLTVNPLPTVSLTANPSPICAGATSTLKATGATTYKWKADSSLSGTTGNTLQASPPATESYYLQGTDSHGCKDSAFIKLPVNPLPVINAPSPEICRGASTTITATGASTFTWSPGTGLNISNGATVIASPAASTTYLIKGTDTNNCSATRMISVTVNPNPQLISPGRKSICQGDSISLTTSGANSYLWTPSTDLNQDTGMSVIARPSQNTTYHITGTNLTGCSDTTSAVVLVNDLPVIKVQSAQTCKGIPIPVTANSLTAVSYSWFPASGLNLNNQATVNANPGQTQTYIVTGKDVNGCVDTAHATVTVNPLPMPAIATPPPICLGQTVNLMAVNTAVKPILTTFLWNPSPDLNTSQGASVIAKPVALKNTYTVNAVDQNGCQASGSVTVSAVNRIIPQISDSVKICKGEEVTLTAGGGNTYLWQNDATTASISVSPVKSTLYMVKIMNSLCSDTASVKVTVKDEIPLVLFIPNAFSPNDDRINDKFKVVANGPILDFKGLIFDRWGELIFEWNDINDGWDGYVKGTLAQIGVYVYTISVQEVCAARDGNPKIGTVTIVR